MEKFFSFPGLAPHGFCLLWDPRLIWTYAISDIGIGIAYFTIPLALAIFARRRRDLVFRPLIWLFVTFILLCGTTHWLDVLTLWVPAYGAEAVVKAITAAVSIITAIVLWLLLPQVLTLMSSAQLEEANAALRESEARLHQAQKMEAVGQLTGGIAHDFNNLLQSVTGGLDLLERRITEGRGQEARRYSAAIRQAVERGSNLTYRLLAFSRRQVLQPQEVDPDTLVQGIAELIRRTVGPAIQLEQRLHDGVWKARCDPNQLESALLNLAINARDAMPDGGTLRISTADRRLAQGDVLGNDEAEAGDYVEIAVTDTGTGMSSDVMARALEPFFTTKPSGQGSGLGLSQVYGFVRQSGGFLQLASTANQGTTVKLFLPRYTPSGGEATNSSAAPGMTETVNQEASGETVLIVEDDPTIRMQIVEVLRALNYKVLDAENGQAGLEIVRSNATLDLVISDVGLPGLSGLRLAEEANFIRPEMPMLLITGYAGTAIDDVQLKPGTKLIYKPFALDTLLARIRDLLDNRVGAQHSPSSIV